MPVGTSCFLLASTKNPMVRIVAAQKISTTLLTPNQPSPPKRIGQLNRWVVGGTSNANI
jgi:hypothetical protein